MPEPTSAALAFGFGAGFGIMFAAMLIALIVEGARSLSRWLKEDTAEPFSPTHENGRPEKAFDATRKGNAHD